MSGRVTELRTDSWGFRRHLPIGESTWRSQLSLILIYLAAIVAANLLVAAFGPAMSVVNAFLFIGLDLSCRDRLHDAWHRRGLVWKMGALIVTGSALTVVFNVGAWRIAVASTVAFASAATVDAGLYHLLLRYPRLLRMNGSNLGGAAVDSVVFPAMAFGGFLWPVMLGQFVAKVVGGFLWSLLLTRKRKHV